VKVEKLEIPRVYIDIRQITLHRPLYYWGRLVLTKNIITDQSHIQRLNHVPREIWMSPVVN
jgi:hypothetical protein